MWPWGRGSREGSIESVETQVGIPVRTMVWLMFGGDLFIVGIAVIGWCNRFYRHLDTGGTYLEWFPIWFSRFRVQWLVVFRWCIGWTITFPIALLIIRFTLEMWDHWWPPADSKYREVYGPMGPLYAIRAALGKIKPLPGGPSRKPDIHLRYQETYQKDK